MKIPVSPPPVAQLVEAVTKQPGLGPLLALVATRGIGPAPDGKYRHWDTFRHAPPLKDEYSVEAQWFAVKAARRALYRTLPLKDADGRPFFYALPNVALEMLHRIDRMAGSPMSDQITSPATRETYLFRSVVEEAITSSQLEGASTTRRVAKSMIQEGRQPRTRSERMILNNYQAMLFVRKFKEERLTPELVMEIQRTLTEQTLDDMTGVGRLRRGDEDIVVEDETGKRLHTPPPSVQLSKRLNAMCAFANAIDEGSDFMPPAVRAVLLHLWLAYDHPFIDGNGRTARALFYWSLARSGYWLCEYVSISRVLKKAKAQYARAYLYTESDENDATYFVLYQLRVLLNAINELHIYLERKAGEMREAENRLSQSAIGDGLNPRQLTLINHALKTPDARYTVESHQTSHGTSYETARSDLMKLVELALLRQSKAGRAFVFTPAPNILDRFQRRSK